MRTNSLFVDTAGWMAQLSPTETYYDQADVELRRAVSNPQITIFTTDHVLAELVALMTTRRFSRQQILDDVGTMWVPLSADRVSPNTIPTGLFFWKPGIC